MNTQSLFVAMLAAAFAGGAFATGKSPAELQQEAQLRAPSTVTRAEVRAEVAAAMARGERLSHGDANRNSPSVHKPHAEVRSAATPRDAVAGK